MTQAALITNTVSILMAWLEATCFDICTMADISANDMMLHQEDPRWFEAWNSSHHANCTIFRRDIFGTPRPCGGWIKYDMPVAKNIDRLRDVRGQWRGKMRGYYTRPISQNLMTYHRVMAENLTHEMASAADDDEQMHLRTIGLMLNFSELDQVNSMNRMQLRAGRQDLLIEVEPIEDYLDDDPRHSFDCREKMYCEGIDCWY